MLLLEQTDDLTHTYLALRVYMPFWLIKDLSQGLGVQTDNMFSPYAQCTEAANKARPLIFQDLSKSAFIPLYGASVRPHFEYGMPACLPNLVADISHLDRIQG